MPEPNSSNELPKLVRDKIPELIVRNEGKTAQIRSLDDDAEFLQALLVKTIEEAQELAACKNDGDMLKELADLYEIIDAILVLKGKTRSDLVAIQNAKREARGGFDKRLMLLGKQ